MDSLYPSLVGCALVLSGGILAAGTTGSGEWPTRLGWYRLGGLVYVIALFAWSITPQRALTPDTACFAVAAVRLLTVPRTRGEWLEILFAGTATGMLANKFMKAFPFQQWHGVSVTILLVLMWTAVAVCTRRNRTLGFHFIDAAYVFFYGCLRLNWLPGGGGQYNVMPLEDPLAGVGANVYWLTIGTYAGTVYLQEWFGKLWSKRYKPVI